MTPAPAEWPAGGSEMAQRIRAFPWPGSPLGTLPTWDPALRAALDVCLGCGFPSVICWGPTRALLYNDAARAILGDLHPAALGQPAADAWPDLWALLAPRLDRAPAEAAILENVLLPVPRAGTAENTWFTLSCGPLRDAHGELAGLLVIGNETTASVHADAALRSSEARLRLIVESASDYAIFAVDANGAIEAWLGGAARVFGWNQANVLGQHVAMLFTPEDRAAGVPARELAAAAEHGESPDIRWHLRQDGTRVFIDGKTIALRGPDGTLQGFLKIGQDVTDRRIADAALRESEERFRQFADASSDVLWIRDAETLNWEYLSRAFETTYGMPIEDAYRLDGLATWAGMILEEDRAHAIASIGRVRTGERARFEYRIRRPDGEVRWLRDTDFPMRNAAGAVERVGGIGQDVTELKRIEAALRDEEARLRALLDGLPQLLWRAHDGGAWTWCSAQWRDYTGQTQEQSHGFGWLDMVHADDRDHARAAWRAAASEGALRIDYRLHNAATGRYAWFQSRGMPVRDGASIVEWIGSSTDIDDQVRAREILARAGEELEARVVERTAELMAAEESLRQSQKMDAVGQLTGGIAHDFNNMLQGVVGALEMARRRMATGRNEQAETFLDAAADAAHRAASLTRRLLAFARRQRLEPKPVSADELVAGLADLIRRTMGPGIAVELTLRDGTGSVMCDPSELESALLNLCINARDAMANGGKLAIRTSEHELTRADLKAGEAAPGRYVSIAVIDTGIGMPPDVLARVFEPFFTTKPQGQGTGLGLSQVYGFVRQSGGLVRIESHPGAGSAVRLFLPLHEHVAVAPTLSIPPTADPTQAAGTVLLIDDESAVRGPARDRLNDMGLFVLEAQDGPDALRILDTLPRLDLLVTDVGLPNGMNGRQVAEAARERFPDLPVLFITGYAGTALPPGVEVIGKPFDLDILARRVAAMLPRGGTPE